VNKTDVLPAALAQACRRHGYRCFKLKITGTDNEADARRTAEVFRAARQIGIANPRLTIDSNEANLDAASVLDYLEQLERIDGDAYQALDYIEQPTARDISATPFDWRLVAARKPVLLDEGLTDLTVLAAAQQQGWSGLALKTCKGHSMLLATAAWAHEHGLLLALQDLTNPGIALIHGALVGAHLPTINGAELNSPQFTPAANAEFLPRLGDLFEPAGGLHRLPETTPIGLGSQL
jgi:L-alanine-DL-glutamate epimerase-like enolase superfamily enzyme